MTVEYDLIKSRGYIIDTRGISHVTLIRGFRTWEFSTWQAALDYALANLD